jgi:hypothetical protein
MKAKLGAIFLVSVLAIAGAGAAYALWYEDLYIWTDIYPGNVDVEWSLGDYWAVGDTKSVSTMDMWIDDSGDPDSPDCTLYCVIWNAYPCVEYHFEFDLHCVGSIPVHFTALEIYDSGWHPIVQPGMIEYMSILITKAYDANGNLLDYNYPIPIEDIQLHEGDTAWGEYIIHFNNNLPQGDELDEGVIYLDLQFMAHQYNEEPDD